MLSPLPITAADLGVGLGDIEISALMKSLCAMRTKVFACSRSSMQHSPLLSGLACIGFFPVEFEVVRVNLVVAKERVDFL